MFSFNVRFLWPVLLVNIGFAACGTEKRTCFELVTSVEENRSWFTKDVLTTRPGLFCCTGYNPVNSTLHFIEVKTDEDCVPFCKQACPGNSTCQPPETCECVESSQFYAKHIAARRCKCNEGFMLTADNQCIPLCPDHCTNGMCNAAECVCKDGYAKNLQQLCVPQCRNGCEEDEQCTDPDICSPKACEDVGFERNVMGECLPICTKGCENGKCTAPDNCTCNDGYEMNAITDECDANCDNCTDGYCLRPHECICSFGFKLKEGVCVDMDPIKIHRVSDVSLNVWIGVWIFLGIAAIATVVGIEYYDRRWKLAATKSNDNVGETS